MAKPETLADYNAYYCEKCNKHVTKAIKNTCIYKLPPIIVFCFQRYRGGKKNMDVVEYPIKDLDMSKHVQNQSNQYKQEEMLYDLYAIVNHLGGGLNSGHYIADCYNEEAQSWYNFNDSTITKISCPDDESLRKRLQSNNNYVLFYKRRNFKCDSKQDFDAIKMVPTGDFDHLIKVTQPSA